ncbi:porin [Paraburkholderia sediminicola]|uniref:porin n=1 Tax=Paraburkholderia sediminicola TaxID=458836 RepID=UPI0038BC1E0F
MFVPSVLAQGTATLYGLIDTGANYISNAKGSSQFSMASGTYTGSRWGLTGSEALGGRLSAVFTLENGFNSLSGATLQNSRMFGRQAFVGMSGRWGSVTLGRQYDMLSNFLGPVSASSLFAGHIGAHPGDIDNAAASNRVDNSIKWRMPDHGPLDLGALYSVGGVAGDYYQKRVVSLGAGYTFGDVLVNVAYETVHNPYAVFYDGATPVAGSIAYVSPATNPIFSGYLSAANLTVWGGGATYKSGKLEVRANYTHSKFSDVVRTTATPLAGSHSFDNWEASAAYNLAPALKCGASFDYLVGGQAHYTQAQTGLDYSLSKRTQVYLFGIWQHAVGTDSTGKRATADITSLTASNSSNQTLITAGLIHRF